MLDLCPKCSQGDLIVESVETTYAAEPEKIVHVLVDCSHREVCKFVKEEDDD